MNKDLKELLLAFNAHGVRYLVVGGYAVGVHAEPRATKDLDILIGTDESNSREVSRSGRLRRTSTGIQPLGFQRRARLHVSDRPASRAARYSAAH